MSLRVAILIHLLLLVDKADSKKGELLFVILMEQSLNVMEVLYLAGTVQRKLDLSCSMSACNTLPGAARKSSNEYISKKRAAALYFTVL